VFIARSLGFAAYLTKCKKSCQNNHSGYYFRVSISGETSAIPTVKKIAGKRLQKKSVLRTGFSVEHIGVGEYFGWEVDGNSRYLMGDFTVTHNSGKSVIAQSLTESALGKGKRIAIIANRVQLVRQMADRFDAHGIHYGILQGGNTNNIHLPVVICSINTVEKRGLPDCDLIIIDEWNRRYEDDKAKFPKKLISKHMDWILETTNYSKEKSENALKEILFLAENIGCSGEKK
jgi:hypothetical protein